jgi:hypothetical protein
LALQEAGGVMEPDTSMTSMTVACSFGASTVAWGLASARISAASAMEIQQGGQVATPSWPAVGHVGQQVGVANWAAVRCRPRWLSR